MKFSQQMRPPTRAEPVSTVSRRGRRRVPRRAARGSSGRACDGEVRAAVRPEEEECVVDRPTLALVRADGEPETVFARNRAERVGVRPRYLDRLFEQSSEETVRRRSVSEVTDPAIRWVHRYERLGEERQLRSARRRLACEGRCLRDRRVAVEDHRLRLHAGHTNGSVHTGDATASSPARRDETSARALAAPSSAASTAPSRPRCRRQARLRRAACSAVEIPKPA